MIFEDLFEWQMLDYNWLKVILLNKKLWDVLVGNFVLVEGLDHLLSFVIRVNEGLGDSRMKFLVIIYDMCE